MPLSRLGEFGLIERLSGVLDRTPTSPAAGEVALGIGDDAAVLGLPPGRRLVTTIDALVEGVHFRRDWSKPEEIGWKSLAVNVSDLGAMGARPLAALVTLAIPPQTEPRWVERLYQGMAECAAAYGCPVVGGDTVRAPRDLTLSIAALGSVAEGREVRRDGARPGDLLCVTGVLGESGAGLALLSGEQGFRKKKQFAPLLEWHRRPSPPVQAGAALAEAGLATAMLDLSDGLASDLRHIVRRSGVGVRLDAERLPISDAARQAGLALKTDPVEWALYGGEDYQLCFTVPEERWPKVPPCLGPLGVAATIVGRITRKGLVLMDHSGKAAPLRPRGFAHFRTPHASDEGV